MVKEASVLNGQLCVCVCARTSACARALPLTRTSSPRAPAPSLPAASDPSACDPSDNPSSDGDLDDLVRFPAVPLAVVPPVRPLASPCVPEPVARLACWSDASATWAARIAAALNVSPLELARFAADLLRFCNPGPFPPGIAPAGVLPCTQGSSDVSGDVRGTGPRNRAHARAPACQRARGAAT
jgi:hypothetical protein